MIRGSARLDTSRRPSAGTPAVRRTIAELFTYPDSQRDGNDDLRWISLDGGRGVEYPDGKPHGVLRAKCSANRPPLRDGLPSDRSLRGSGRFRVEPIQRGQQPSRVHSRPAVSWCAKVSIFGCSDSRVWRRREHARESSRGLTVRLRGIGIGRPYGQCRNSSNGDSGRGN